jgi:hypothetical protein
MDISSIVARSLAALQEKDEFPAFPGNGKPTWNGQVIDNKLVSMISRFPGQNHGTLGKHHTGHVEPIPFRERLEGSRVESPSLPGKPGNLEKIGRARVSAANPPGKDLERPGKGTDQESWFPDPDTLVAFEERAAILEYDAGLPREEAEAIARAELLSANQSHP